MLWVKPMERSILRAKRIGKSFFKEVNSIHFYQPYSHLYMLKLDLVNYANYCHFYRLFMIRLDLVEQIVNLNKRNFGCVSSFAIENQLRKNSQ